MDFLERVALWAVVIICVTLLRVLIRAARRGGGKMPPPQPGMPMPPQPVQRNASPPVPQLPSTPPPPAMKPAAAQAAKPVAAYAGGPAIAQADAPAARPATARFEIVGLSGEYAGQHFRPGDTELVFGRDAAMVHVVYPQSFSAISKRHCRLFGNSAGRVWIEDTWSANGTFVAELRPGKPAATTRLQAGTPHELKAGDAFCLAGPDQMFRLERNA